MQRRSRRARGDLARRRRPTGLVRGPTDLVMGAGGGGGQRPRHGPRRSSRAGASTDGAAAGGVALAARPVAPPTPARRPPLPGHHAMMALRAGPCEDYARGATQRGTRRPHGPRRGAAAAGSGRARASPAGGVVGSALALGRPSVRTAWGGVGAAWGWGTPSLPCSVLWGRGGGEGAGMCAARASRRHCSHRSGGGRRGGAVVQQSRVSAERGSDLYPVAGRAVAQTVLRHEPRGSHIPLPLCGSPAGTPVVGPYSPTRVGGSGRIRTRRSTHHLSVVLPPKNAGRTGTLPTQAKKRFILLK